MPQKKKPSTLQNLALRALKNSISHAGSCVIRKICDEYLTCLVNTHFPQLKTHNRSEYKPKVKSEVIAWVKEVMSSVPHEFADTLTRDLLLECNIMFHDHYYMNYGAPHPECHQWINDFVKACLHRSLRTLNFKDFSLPIQEILCSQFQNLQLQELQLMQMNQVSFKTIKDSGFLHFKNLQSFSYQYDCTDEVVQEICKNCSTLRKLVISFSSLVTQKSIPHIHKLQQLQYVDVNKTKLTEDGMLTLLEGLPSLEILYSPDSFITESQHVFPNISSISIIAEISAVPKMFPNLVHLSTCPDSYTDDISIIAEIKTLKSLHIINCSFESSNISGLLEKCGMQLLSLKFTQVDDIYAGIVDTCCKNLKELSYRLCTFNWKPYIFPNLTANPHYENLVKLCLKSRANDTFLNNFPILSYSHLKYLSMESILTFNEEFIKNAVSKNAWKELQFLHAECCSTVRPDCIILLLEHCENLSQLSGTFGERICKQFHEYIKTHNLDLKLL